MTTPTRPRSGHPAARPNRPPPAGALAFLALAILAPLSLVALPLVLLFGLGLVPTLVAAVVDKDPDRSATVCVGALNVAGVAPFAVAIWQGTQGSSTAVELLTDPFTWLVMYGASALGWLVYFGVPPIAAAIQALLDESRLGEIEEEREGLIHTWGPEVTGQAPADGGPAGGGKS